ncbi:hypothetical protein CCACVL1_06641 [Corchorus capsularis]|uniref:F-box domain-containing protein n=1 Tax=Corchorus capsularis TaxID=210143 RepID=A0A1R3JE16_COCAP|nr:hypothetical protein CCACVL1_06641 [Corchorus capsularis]
MKSDICITNILPEECISYILSLTSPPDVCRSKLVSPVFRSAADSDTIWGKFLPSDCYDIISKASSSSAHQLTASMSKTQLYFHLCNKGVLIDNGSMSFGLDKATGKKCFMLGARRLSIAWVNTPTYWRWKQLPESRFSEVAELKHVWWLDVKGTIETKILSPQTTYVAYLVYKFATSKSGFDKRPVDLHVELEQSHTGRTVRVFLDPSSNIPQFSRTRGDGWMEVKLGEFFNEHGDDGNASCSLREWEYLLLSEIIFLVVLETNLFNLMNRYAASANHSKEELGDKDSKKLTSLSDFLNRKLPRSSDIPKTVQEKSKPFSSLLRPKDGETVDKQDERKKEEETMKNDVLDKVVLEQFKQDNAEKADFITPSGGAAEVEEEVVEIPDTNEVQNSRKRQNPFQVADEERRTRKPFLVLGDDPERSKRRGKRECSISKEKPKPHYNHYANGSGWWDCDMEGVDSEEVGLGEIWEGVGSTTFGGIVDWH